MEPFQIRQRTGDIPTRDQRLAVDARQVNHFRQILAGGNVNIGVIAERAARQRIEALEDSKAMRHDENHADIRHKGDRADLIHEVAIHLRALQAHDAAQRHVEDAGAGFLMLGVNPHGKSLRALQRQERLAHMLLRADQREKRAVGIGRARAAPRVAAGRYRSRKEPKPKAMPEAGHRP